MILQSDSDPSGLKTIAESDLWGATEQSIEVDELAASEPYTLASIQGEAAEMLYQLAVSALALASAHIEIRLGAERIFACTSCGKTAHSENALHHRSGCLAAEVIRRIQWLKHFQYLEPNSERKEDVSVRNKTSCAVEGVRPRFSLREPWRYERASEPGVFRLVDCEGCERAIVGGRFVERLATAEAIVRAVNWVAGKTAPEE